MLIRLAQPLLSLEISMGDRLQQQIPENFRRLPLLHSNLACACHFTHFVSGLHSYQL